MDRNDFINSLAKYVGVAIGEISGFDEKMNTDIAESIIKDGSEELEVPTPQIMLNDFMTDEVISKLSNSGNENVRKFVDLWVSRLTKNNEQPKDNGENNTQE